MTTRLAESGNRPTTLADGLRLSGCGLLRFARYFLACLDVAGQRRQLLALDDRGLRDLGISRSEALIEANRSFWDIPEARKARAGGS